LELNVGKEFATAGAGMIGSLFMAVGHLIIPLRMYRSLQGCIRTVCDNLPHRSSDSRYSSKTRLQKDLTVSLNAMQLSVMGFCAVMAESLRKYDVGF